MSGPRRDYASWGGSRNSEGRHENSGSRGDQRSRNDSSKYSRHRGSENVDKPDMCKRKGYQEARRQDRDRRDRRNERLGLGSDEYYEKSKVDDTFQLSTVKEAKSDFTVTHSVKESDLETKISKHVPDKRYDMSGKRYETKYLPLEKCSRTVPVKSKSDTLKPMKAPFRDNLKKNEVKDGGDTSKKSTDPKTDANKKSTAAGENSCTDTKGVNKAPGLMNLLQQSTDKKAKSQEKEPSAKELKSKGMTASDLEKQWQKEEEERKKREDEEMKKQKEEENKRLEEEKRIQDEEARKKKEEEEAELLTQEEIKTLEDFIKLTKENNEQKLNLREINICAEENYPDDSYFSRLDSSLKKTTAFVKKIKNLTETQKDSLTKDFNGLNLTKYIGELANGIAEAKLKMSDIGCALHISSLAHRRYADFASAFLESWQKVLLTKKDEKVPNPSKLRVDLRFFADLVMGGVFSEKEGLSILANQLNLLIANDKEEHNNLSIIISFCKHCGDDYAGLVPRKHRLLSEKYSIIIPRSSILPEERKKGCSRLLKEYYGSLCTHLHGEHKELKSIERQNRKILQTKGELTQERKDKHEAALQVFQKLMQNTYTFADLLDEDVPQLPEEKMETEDEIMGIDIYSPDNEFVYDGENTLFEDEDTRQFYENVPDLKSIVPQILYKDSEQAAKSDKNNEQEAVAEEEELDVEELEKEMEKGQKEADTSLEEEPLAPPDIEDDDFDIAASMRQILDAFLTSLPTCVNRDLIDKAAIDFCMNLNTKANRKKLVKTLFTVQRTRYDLLPFYSRLIATLHPCMPEVASDLVTLLKGDFKWHVRKKDQINIESKLKTVRFIGELVKFNMFPKAEALHCIKMLLFDFSHHNIEMACSLLETCGRFLYRCPDSHHRTKIYLAVIMRKKTALHFDQRYCTLIENAYYYSNPPESKKEEVVQRPPMHEYIRKLLYKDLSKITTEKILRQLRKLNWDDNEICAYTTKCLWAIWNVRYNVIHCCANLLAGLAAYHENVAISVVDGVIEDVRYGLEINHPKYNQRRVSCVKYLGELYNYRLVESSVIFKTLYSFITFGITYDDYASPLDPPEHLFRVRLVCVLLDTCGQYFDRGSSKKKLDCFLVYFQNYYWFKRKNPVWTDVHPFPVEMEYSYHDTLEILRPKLPIAKSFEEASAAVEELEKEFRAKLAEILPRKSEDEFTEQLEETDGTLTTIKETEEIDDLSQSMAQVQLIGSDVMTPHSQSQDSEDGYRSTQRSGSQSQSQQRETDEGEEQTGGKDYDAESDSHTDIDTEDEEQINLMMAGPKVIECTEDDDFMTAFDKMLTDNIQNRMQESTKVPTLDIAVPMHIKSQKTKYFMPGEDDLVEEEETDTKSGVKFVLMTKRGNKQQFSNLSVPVSEKFATEYKERENAEKLEKERMKRVVLNIHERQEEEDYQEMMASMSRAVGSNVPRKEPKQRHYHHPKGAPDAELIFGSKQNPPREPRKPVELEKIILKDIPQQVSNQVVKQFLTDHGVQLKGMIKMQFDSKTKQKGAYVDFTERTCYAVKPVDPPLPVIIILDGHEVKICHESQQVCYVCAKPGHRHGTDECPGHLSQDNESVIPFQGHTDALSNFFPCKIKIFGLEFKNSEAAYQWRKATDLGFHDIAKEIFSCKQARDAKRLSNDIEYNKSVNWEQAKVDIMQEILEAKVICCEPFRSELETSGNKIIAEATNDKFWGTGLFKPDTLRTDPSFWPGKNMLGKMHMQLRQRLLKEEFSSSNNSKTRNQVNSNNSNNLDVYCEPAKYKYSVIVEENGWIELHDKFVYANYTDNEYSSENDSFSCTSISSSDDMNCDSDNSYHYMNTGDEMSSSCDDMLCSKENTIQQEHQTGEKTVGRVADYHSERIYVNLNQNKINDLENSFILIDYNLPVVFKYNKVVEPGGWLTEEEKFEDNSDKAESDNSSTHYPILSVSDNSSTDYPIQNTDLQLESRAFNGTQSLKHNSGTIHTHYCNEIDMENNPVSVVNSKHSDHDRSCETCTYKSGLNSCSKQEDYSSSTSGLNLQTCRKRNALSGYNGSVAYSSNLKASEKQRKQNKNRFKCVYSYEKTDNRNSRDASHSLGDDDLSWPLEYDEDYYAPEGLDPKLSDPVGDNLNTNSSVENTNVTTEDLSVLHPHTYLPNAFVPGTHLSPFEMMMGGIYPSPVGTACVGYYPPFVGVTPQRAIGTRPMTQPPPGFLVHSQNYVNCDTPEK